jgi:hypothetical protein
MLGNSNFNSSFVFISELMYLVFVFIRQPVGFVTFSSREEAESARQALQVRVTRRRWCRAFRLQHFSYR